MKNKIGMPLVIAIVGAAVGYLVLSPFAMYISHIVHIDILIHEMAIKDVLMPENFKWFLPFMAFGGMTGLLVGILYSRQKRVERALQKAHDGLELHVDERTAELKASNEQLKRGIAERKRAEEELKRSHAFLDTVLNSVNDSISVIDTRDFKILDVNRTFLEKLGLEKEDVIGKPCYTVTHHREEPCRRPEDPCPLYDTLKTGKPASYEHVHYTKDNKKEYVEVYVCPIIDEKGEFTRAVHVARDLTERKLKEQALEKYTKDLEEANCFKDLFTDIMRHDLLNPVGVICNIVEILAMGENNKGSAELEVIKRNVKKLEDIITDASMFGKLESAEKLDTEELSLTELMQSAIDDVGLFSLEKGMIFKFDDSEKHVMLASSGIESVFLNLLSNAIKYSGEGTEITITIEDDGEGKIVSIADQGSGIADEYKEAVFTRFTRRDKEGVKGSGLGLAIVKRIVDLHGGRVWVEDNPEGGAVFKVSLPRGAR